MSPLEIIAQGADNFNTLYDHALEFAENNGVSRHRAQIWWNEADVQYRKDHGKIRAPLNMCTRVGPAFKYANALREKAAYLNTEVMINVRDYNH